MKKQLEYDITTVNEHIYQLNGRNEVRTIRLEKKLCKSTTKRRGRQNQYKKVLKSYVYDQLYDGVHGNDALKLEWFAFVRTSVQRDIITQSQPSDFIPEDEEPHSRSWWNERQVTFK